MSHRTKLDLLIACAFPPGTQVGDRVRSAVSASVNWDTVQTLAAYHRMQPLLYSRLAEHVSAFVPDDVMSQLANEFRAGAGRNLYLTGELISLTKAFASADIAVLPHKGPLLAYEAYQDLAMRQFADLDLLIHPSDLPKAITVLKEHGYSCSPELAWLSPAALLRWTGEMSYASATGVSVDLHWRLTPSHYTVQLDAEILWRHTTTFTLAGSRLPALKPEAQLLLLSVHGAKHCWESLGWLADIAWLLQAHPGLHWDAVAPLAAEAHCERAVALAAELVGAVFHGKTSTDPLVRRVLDRWYSQPAESPRSPELLRFAADLAERPFATIKHLAGLLFDPTEIDWRSRHLPERWFWLYAPARAARLLGKHLLRKGH